MPCLSKCKILKEEKCVDQFWNSAEVIVIVKVCPYLLQKHRIK
jgi:hypothetical protein